jgi:ribosomal protein S27E
MFAVAGLMSPKRRVTRSTRAEVARVKSMRCGICWHQEVIFCHAATV